MRYLRFIYGTLLICGFSLYVNYVTALYCYKCHNSMSDGDCVNLKQLKIAKHKKIGLVANCTDGQSKCMIETFETQGRHSSFIRDCSDGITFSNDVKKIDRINKTIRADNRTVCSYYQGNVVCLTLCTTDFCNGPQLSNSASITDSAVMIISAFNPPGLTIFMVLLSLCSSLFN